MVAQGDVCLPVRLTAAPRPVVQVKVNTVDGVEIPVDVAESEEEMQKMTAQELKLKIAGLVGNPAQITPDTTLVYNGNRLDTDSKPLREYGLKPKCRIQLVVTVHGGLTV